MKATYTLLYNRRNQLNKQGKAQVIIQVYYNKERKWLNTKIYLTPREWDAKRNEVSMHHPASDELNRELREHIEKLKTHEQNEAKAGRTLMLSSLSLDSLQMAAPGISFTRFWETWIETDQQLEQETKRSHGAHLNRLKEFKREVHFFELTTELLGGYEKFLLDYRFSKGSAED